MEGGSPSASSVGSGAAPHERLQREHGADELVEIDPVPARLRAPQPPVVGDDPGHAVDLLLHQIEELGAVSQVAAAHELAADELGGALGGGEGVLKVVGHLIGELAEVGKRFDPGAVTRPLPEQRARAHHHQAGHGEAGDGQQRAIGPQAAEGREVPAHGEQRAGHRAPRVKAAGDLAE